ncbi:MAG: hypothetical protein AB1664_18345 [Thermodesulfobacteriota bacterium]
MNSQAPDEFSPDTVRIGHTTSPDETIVDYYPGLLTEMTDDEIECRERAFQQELFGGYECRDVPCS